MYSPRMASNHALPCSRAEINSPPASRLPGNPPLRRNNITCGEIECAEEYHMRKSESRQQISSQARISYFRTACRGRAIGCSDPAKRRDSAIGCSDPAKRRGRAIGYSDFAKCRGRAISCFGPAKHRGRAIGSSDRKTYGAE